MPFIFLQQLRNKWYETRHPMRLGDHMTISHADAQYLTEVATMRGKRVNTGPVWLPSLIIIMNFVTWFWFFIFRVVVTALAPGLVKDFEFLGKWKEIKLELSCPALKGFSPSTSYTTSWINKKLLFMFINNGFTAVCLFTLDNPALLKYLYW